MLAVQAPSNELLQFKVALCDIEFGDESKAKLSIKNITYPGDSPAWYYAQAAWEYRYGIPKKLAPTLPQPNRSSVPAPCFLMRHLPIWASNFKKYQKSDERSRTDLQSHPITPQW